MKISTLALVLGLTALSVSACTVPNYDDTECSGFLGCSGELNANGQETRIGPPEAVEQKGNGMNMCPAPPMANGKVDVNAVWKGKGCGKDLPGNQAETIVGTPKGYTQRR
jgi:hypothetical protein